MKNYFETQIKVGIVGTGFIGRGLSKLILNRPDMKLSKILTRRSDPIEDLGVSQDYVTRTPEELMNISDLIVVCSGDPIYSTEMIDLAFTYNLPVVTMDADTFVLTGSWLSHRGLISEGNGDQPGCLAVLDREAREMGFKPLVYGNIKGFLNHHPKLEDMIYWAQKQNFSLNSVTSFTDGTKLQIEQCLVANGLNATIAKQGLIGIQSEDFEKAAFNLAEKADEMNVVLSDFVVSRNAPPGVFIVAKHEENLASALRTYKMGDGPYYLLYKPVHLCFFELPGTILNLFHRKEILLDNGNHPSVSVAAVTKQDLKSGTLIKKGIGSMEMRGEAMKFSQQPDHVPIGLLQDAVLKRSVSKGDIITFHDVDLPESLALQAWRETLKNFSTPPIRKVGQFLSI